MYKDCYQLPPHQQKLLQLCFGNLSDRISEYTISNYILYHQHYQFSLQQASSHTPLIIYGQENGKTFAMLPEIIPDTTILDKLFKTIDYIKAIPERLITTHQNFFLQHGYRIIADRDHFDYLYSREDLAFLKGRKYHKKRNLVHQFEKKYHYQINQLSNVNIAAAWYILHQWQERHNNDTDFQTAQCALLNKNALNLSGILIFVNNKPAAYSLGEIMPTTDTYLVHSEKALVEYQGIYQFLNMMSARMLAPSCIYINREQDLGIAGLRQAKMSYRPLSFIKKYRLTYD